jgi:D-alanyl-D-alanine carboxypeptidase
MLRIIRPAALMLATAVSVAAMIQLPASMPGEDGEEDRGEVAAALEAHVKGIVDPGLDDPIHNAILLVKSPTISWEGAAGIADGLEEAMTADHKFKIASIAKTMTATVVLQLVEEGRLSLDDTLEKFVDSSIVDLDTLLIHQGTSCGRRITIRQLLGHTSGIPDYMEDPQFVPFVLEHADTQWSPEMIFGCYYEWEVNTKPTFSPGEDFIYSDLNYVLLAMIIEKATDSTLAEQYRKRIFDPLGMTNSYLEFYEEPRGSSPLSHAFLGGMDISASINTSFDWGGGGVVSTCEDLDVFFRALLGGRLFTKESTLRQMLAAADLGHGGKEYDYGFGIMKRTIGGLSFYGHGGAYDCDVFFSPDAGISICTVLNQMETHGKRDPFLEKAVSLVLTVPPEPREIQGNQPSH